MEGGSTERAAMAAVEEAKKRCKALTQRIIHSEKLSNLSSKTTLLRLIQSELSFLRRLSHPFSSAPLSVNIGHLEAVVHVLQQPFVSGVSRVCKPVVLSPSKRIYVDIVCSLNGNPVWFIVSDRNPRYIFWDRNEGLKTRIRLLLQAANESPVTLRPSSIIFFFANGLDDGDCQKFRDEFGATDLEIDSFSYEELQLEEDWTNVNLIGRSFPKSCVLQTRVGTNGFGMNDKHLLDSAGEDILSSCKKNIESCDLNLGASFCSLVSGLKCGCCFLDLYAGLEDGSSKELFDGIGAELVNFDTTTMIAIVSGISNGGSEKLLAKPESEVRGRFKGNYEFVIAQVNSEIQNPIHGELAGVISGKIGIICESVHSEFQELISMCGGPNEISRAHHFLKFLKYSANKLFMLKWKNLYAPDIKKKRWKDVQSLSPKLQVLALMLIILLVDRLSTINWQVPTIFTFLSFRVLSLMLTGSLILRSNGILPVCCCSCNASRRVLPY